MKRKNKYFNKRTKSGFDSKGESRRYNELILLERANEITELVCQPRFDFIYNNIKICYYKADFSYKNKEGDLVVEDYKSSYTAKLPVYRLKKKLMKAFYDINIVEVIKK